MRFSNGDEYVGEWQNNKQSGHGTHYQNNKVLA